MENEADYKRMYKKKSPNVEIFSWIIPGIRTALLQCDQALRHPESADFADTMEKNISAVIGAFTMVGELPLKHIFIRILHAFAQKKDTGHWLAAGKSASIRQGLYAIIEYLEDVKLHTINPVLYLFPYYKNILEALDVPRIYPSDLYFSIFMDDVHFVECDYTNGKSKKANYDVLKSDFEKALRLYSKDVGREDKQKPSLAEMKKVIEKVVCAQESLAGKSFWGVIEGALETFDHGIVKSDVYVRHFLEDVAAYLKQSTAGTIVLHRQLLCDALFYVMHGQVDAESLVQRIRDVYQFPGIVESDYKTSCYLGIDPILLVDVKEQLNQVQSLWNGLIEGMPHQEKSFIAGVNRLRAQGDALGSVEMAELFGLLKRSMPNIIRNKNAYSVKLEVARVLLFMDAGLHNIYQLSDDFPQMVGDCAVRLHAALGDKYQDVPLLSARAMVRDEHYKKTMTVIADEMMQYLIQVESLLEILFFNQSHKDNIVKADALMRHLQDVFTVLHFTETVAAIAHSRMHVHAMHTQEVGKEDIAKMVNNIASFYFVIKEIHSLVHVDAQFFTFDQETGMYAMAISPEENSSIVPTLEKFNRHFSRAKSRLQVEEVYLPEAEDGAAQDMADSPTENDADVVNAFFMEVESLLVDMRNILEMFQFAMEDQGLMESLLLVFHTLKGSARMAGVHSIGDAAMALEHLLHFQMAGGAPGSDDCYRLLTMTEHTLQMWLKEMKADGVSKRKFTILIRASQDIMQGTTPSYKKG